jgi:hypothetical protein
MRCILQVEQLETRLVPAGVIAIGSGPGVPPVVELFHDTNNDGVPDGGPFPVPYASIPVMDPGFRGGVRVAVGNFTGDSKLELAVVAGPGGGPRVQIFKLDANDVPTGTPESFYALVPVFTGGLFCARANTLGTGLDSLIVTADAGGGPQVQIFNDNAAGGGANDGLLSNSLVDNFYAFAPTFTGGVRVAAGRNLAAAGGDLVAFAEGPGGNPRVTIVKDANSNYKLSDNLTLSAAIAASPNGASEAGSTVTITTTAAHNFVAGEMVTIAGVGVGGYNGTFKITLTTATTFTYTAATTGLTPSGGGTAAAADSFDVFGGTWSGGLFVALGDAGSPSTNPELIVSADAGGGPRVVIYSDSNLNGKYADEPGPVSSFYAYDPSYTGGVRVAYSRLSSANVGASGEVIVAPGAAPGFGGLPVEVLKTKSNTGEIGNLSDALALLYPFRSASIAATPTGATEVGNTVTITTTTAHPFAVGESVQVSNVSQAGYNGTFVITSVPTATSFTYTDPISGLIASGGGSVYGVYSAGISVAYGGNGLSP